jgi:hypothetical protein
LLATLFFFSLSLSLSLLPISLTGKQALHTLLTGQREREREREKEREGGIEREGEKEREVQNCFLKE